MILCIILLMMATGFCKPQYNPELALNRSNASLLDILPSALANFKKSKSLEICSNRGFLLPLLILAGDIHPNPGPRALKYPCSACHKAVKNRDFAICCDNCDSWIHKDCCGMSTPTYRELQNSSGSWICPSCNLPNFSSTLFSSSPIEVGNAFNVLSDNSLSCVNSPEIVRTSSPVRAKPKLKKNASKIFSVQSLNINGIRSKKACLSALLDIEKPDILCLQETKIDSSMHSAEFFGVDYDIFRKDRNESGGGVIIAVNKNLGAVEWNFQSSLEMVWIKVNAVANPTYIGCCYRPPGVDADFSSSLHSCLSDLIAKHPKSLPTIMLLGDFNYPGISWYGDIHVPAPTMGGDFINVMDCFSLEQLVKDNTRYFGLNSSNLLDLVLCNFPGKISDLQVTDSFSDHCSIKFNLSLDLPDLYSVGSKKIKNFSKANFKEMKTKCLSFSQNFIRTYLSNTVNENWCKFKNFIQEITEAHVPTKILKKSYKTWVSAEDRKLINKRNRLSRKAKKSNNIIHRQKYKKFRNFVSKKLKISRNNHINKIIDNITDNPKPFYRYINSNKVDKNSIPSLLHNNKEVTNSTEKASVFNNYFSSVFNKSNNMIALPHSKFPSIIQLVVCEQGVLNLLSKLNPTKSPGPDDIATKVLIELRIEIAPILTHIFNQSLSQECLPTDWTNANVFPLHKKGARNLPDNYRPISLTSVCCKLFEHIVHSHISKFLSKHKILNPNQHGFRKDHSCGTQLVSAVYDWSLSLDHKVSTDVAVFDFSKAFDSVPHKLLLSKLQYFGIRGNLLNWISAFLIGRQQRVVLDGCPSNWLPVTSGVPQGSVLGPLLFILYINDIGDNIKSTIRLFADDLIMYRAILNRDDINVFQSDLDTLYNWSTKWEMNFNLNKCNLIKISKKQIQYKHKYFIGSYILPYCDKFTYLGVTITSDLNWSEHITNISRKATNILNFVKRNLYFANTECKSKAYTSLVRPHVEYAAAAWDPHYNKDIKTLQAVQNRAARFATNTYSLKASVTKLNSDLAWPPLDSRRKLARLTEFFKILKGLSPITSTPLQQSSRVTRNSSSGLSFMCLASNSDVFKYSFFPRTIVEWNSLPLDIRSSSSVDSFRYKLSCHLSCHMSPVIHNAETCC